MSEMIIQIKNLQKYFGEKEVLKDVNITLSRGEILGLLGPSGAGKTTLIKILTGQLDFDSGMVEVLGLDLSKYHKELYSNIGMVFDDSGVYERLSCYDNLKLFAAIHRVRTERIYEVLDQVGLSDARKVPVQKLSKGMKQRLILARAILPKPELLFLDEPTSGLDPATARQIHNLLLKLKDNKTTILLTTHNMEEATKLCDTVALLNEGRIVETGVPEELCRKYNTKKNVTILLKSGEEILVSSRSENAQQSAQQIAQLFLQDEVETIHSSEPNLEGVFMELTGRGLMQE